MSIRVTDINLINNDTKDFLETIFTKDNERESFNKMYQLLNNDNHKEMIGINAENAVANISFAYDFEEKAFEGKIREKYNEDTIKSYKDNLQEAKKFIAEISDALSFISHDDNNRDFKSPIDVLEAFNDAVKNTSLYNEEKIDLGNDIVDLDLSDIQSYTVDFENPIISTRNIFEDNYKEIAEEVSFDSLDGLYNNIVENAKQSDIDNGRFSAMLYNEFKQDLTKTNDSEEIIEAEIVEHEEPENNMTMGM
ncbi:hypothetical protein [Poseidonibacter ostreae]|uniref:Uncharacterized protein n=1 Tax=Poseidonibacter ostreae TaxID=2654171 RepID=A0A6L4WW47_9BACT|nr:hypothetical protein [Poseidonibacter ostreae]KAB7891256.1 hypothetical protein GBG19_00035 [Poseidonibacter ostreae]